MRRLLTLLSLAATILSVSVPAARAQSLLFDYVGFDYESPDPNPSDFGEPGSGYVGLGTVPYLFAPLVSNQANFEYTYFMQGLAPTGSLSVGNFRIINYSTGTITLYEDSRSSGTVADFGTNPPSAQAPATFVDGTPILVGTLTNFQLVIDVANGTGSFEGVFNVTGGTQQGNFPLNQRRGWTFAGSTGNALNIPPGYAHQIDGQTFLDAPVAVRRTSWGQLKAAFR